MDVDVPNPAFQRAIPHGTVIIDSLPQVVIVGVSPGCLRALSPGGLQSPFRGCFQGLLGEHSGSIFQGSHSNSNPNHAQ